MTALNSFLRPKAIEYNTIIENEICFSDSISSVIQKIGRPSNTEKSDNQITLEYKRKIHSLFSTEHYCFNDHRLCSVCYESYELTDDKLQNFLSKIENIINKNIFDSVICYTSCGNKYWELSDGAVSMQICLYIEDSKAHIEICYFD